MQVRFRSLCNWRRTLSSLGYKEIEKFACSLKHAKDYDSFLTEIIKSRDSARLSSYFFKSVHLFNTLQSSNVNSSAAAVILNDCKDEEILANYLKFFVRAGIDVSTMKIGSVGFRKAVRDLTDQMIENPQEILANEKPICCLINLMMSSNLHHKAVKFLQVKGVNLRMHIDIIQKLIDFLYLQGDKVALKELMKTRTLRNSDDDLKSLLKGRIQELESGNSKKNSEERKASLNFTKKVANSLLSFEDDSGLFKKRGKAASKENSKDELYATDEMYSETVINLVKGLKEGDGSGGELDAFTEFLKQNLERKAIGNILNIFRYCYFLGLSSFQTNPIILKSAVFALINCKNDGDFIGFIRYFIKVGLNPILNSTRSKELDSEEIELKNSLKATLKKKANRDQLIAFSNEFNQIPQAYICSSSSIEVLLDVLLNAELFEVLSNVVKSIENKRLEYVQISSITERKKRRPIDLMSFKFRIRDDVMIRVIETLISRQRWEDLIEIIKITPLDSSLSSRTEKSIARSEYFLPLHFLLDFNKIKKTNWLSKTVKKRIRSALEKNDKRSIVQIITHLLDYNYTDLEKDSNLGHAFGLAITSNRENTSWIKSVVEFANSNKIEILAAEDKQQQLFDIIKSL
jgi:hypothetical protein